jgi:hypothetical protein
MSNVKDLHSHWIIQKNCPNQDCYKSFQVPGFDLFWGLGRYTHVPSDIAGKQDRVRKAFFGSQIYDLKYGNPAQSSLDERVIALAVSIENFLRGMNLGTFEIGFTVPSSRPNTVNLMRLVMLRLYKAELIRGMTTLDKKADFPTLKSIAREKRHEIVANKFQYTKQYVSNSEDHFLVLDDVFDSGATMTETARAIRVGYPKAKILGIAVTYLKDPKVKP